MKSILKSKINALFFFIILILLLSAALPFQWKKSPPPVSGTVVTNERFSLPIFNITTDPADLWAEDKGIYILGKKASKKYPYKGANYWQDRQIPVHISYKIKGATEFSMDAGLEIFGGETRTLPQKSFALYAKDKYGLETFNYPFFSEKAINHYKTLVLRNGGQDFARTHMLDGLVSVLVKDTEIDYQAYRPVIVILNDEYWGIYDLREKIDKYFLSANHNVSEKDVDLLETNAVTKEGNNEDYIQLINFITSNDLSEDKNYRYLLQKMDIENFMDYVITELYIANTDWPGNNIRFWKGKKSSEKWRWIIYDSDLSFGDYQENTVERLITYSGKGDDSLYISFLFRELVKNPTFRSQFSDRLDYHLKYTFQPERVILTINKLKNQIEPEMPKHFAKWGGSMEEWRSRLEDLEEFAEKRPEYLKKHIESLFKTF